MAKNYLKLMKDLKKDYSGILLALYMYICIYPGISQQGSENQRQIENLKSSKSKIGTLSSSSRANYSVEMMEAINQ